MKLRALLLLCVLAAMLIIASWFYRSGEPVAPIQTEAPRGYYLNEARITQTDDTGQIRYALTANRIEQDLTTDRIHLHTLTLAFRDERADAWQLNAHTGWLDNRTQQAAFAGDVTIQPGATKNTYLLTDSLTVDLATQTASTRDTVTLRMNEQQVTAQGLFANIKTRKLQLESQVHGTFALPGQLRPGNSTP